jgi:uncharacterized protein (TIGR03067 family)
VLATNLPDIPAEDSPEWTWRELRPILDEEINRLPEKYRQAFVLCYLESQTNEQAADQLGCPLGTVLSRLARARKRLRARLTRRGLVLSMGALSFVLASKAAGANVPPELTEAALQAPATFPSASTATNTLSSSVSGLTNGFLQSLSRTRRIRVAIGLLAVTLAAVILLLLLRHPLAAPALPPKTDRELLQGTWRVSRVVRNGGVWANPDLRLNFAGDECSLTSNLGLIPAHYQLDSTQTPKEITLRPQLGGLWPGIYLLEGDSLKICLNQDGPNRPTTFTSQAGDTVFLYVLEREPASP